MRFVARAMHWPSEVLPRRPPGRRQDVAGAERRARDRAQVRPDGAWRHARRGGDSRPPPHLHRLHAGPGAAEPVEDRHAQPAVPARRDRQAGHGLPRRPVVGAAGSARPGAEPHLQRPLRRGRLRPVGRDVRGHQQFDEHPAGAAGPDGSHPPGRLHRGREAQHRPALPAAQAAEEQRRQGRGDGAHRRCAARDHPLLHAGGGRAFAGARDLQDLPQGGQGHPARPVQGPGRRDRGQPQRLSGRAQARLRPRREEEPGRTGRRPGVSATAARPT